MISEHDIAQLCLDIYQGQPAQWDQLEVPPDGVASHVTQEDLMQNLDPGKAP